MTQIPVNTLAGNPQPVRLLPLGDRMAYDFQRPHRHDYFELFLFNQGGGVHFIDFKEYPITAQSVHIIFPNQVHLLRRTEARGQIIICMADFIHLLPQTFLNELHQYYFTAPCRTLPEQSFNTLSGITGLLDSELRNESIFTTEQSRNYISLFLVECIRQAMALQREVVQQQHPYQSMLYHRFKQLLELHFKDKQNVAFYAGSLSVTPKVLSNAVKAVTGKTCVDLLQERTLTEAKRLLLYANENVKEIAYELNFKDVSYFSRFFTRLEGKSPKAFKAYWEEKYHY